jgi:hypothetical protein
MSELKGGSPVVRAALASSHHRKHCRRLAIRASLLTAGEEHDEVSEAEEQESEARNYDTSTVSLAAPSRA